MPPTLDFLRLLQALQIGIDSTAVYTATNGSSSAHPATAIPDTFTKSKSSHGCQHKEDGEHHWDTTKPSL
jgi:hypothetical protein